MAKISAVLIVVLVIGLGLAAANLKCYEQLSGSDTTQEKTCEDSGHICYKKIMKGITTKGCSKPLSSQDRVSCKTTNGDISCQCDTNLCNSSLRTGPAALFTVLVLALAAYL